MTKMFDLFEEEITHVCDQENVQIGKIDQSSHGYPHKTFLFYYNFISVGKMKVVWDEYEMYCDIEMTISSKHGDRTINRMFHFTDKYGWFVFMKDYTQIIQDMKKEGESERFA